MIRKIYQIDLGYDDEKCQWVSQTFSIADQKMHSAFGTKLGPLIDRIKKTLRKKQRAVEKFPLPEENKLVILPDKMILPPKLVIPSGIISNGS